MDSPFSKAACLARTALLACLAFPTSCAHDPYAGTSGHRSAYSDYERYEPSLVQLGRMSANGVHGHTDDPFVPYRFSDQLVFNYADHVTSILRGKFTGARLANYTSGTLQVILAGLAGASAAFSFGATTTAALGLSSAAMPQIGNVFNAKSRAETYQDAIRLIEQAEAEYLVQNPQPSDTILTPNGVILYQRVTATVHIVEKALVGQLPTPKEMELATQPMSASGAIRHRVGQQPASDLSIAGTAIPPREPITRIPETTKPQARSGTPTTRQLREKIVGALRRLSDPNIQKEIIFRKGLQVEANDSPENTVCKEIIKNAKLNGVEPTILGPKGLNRFQHDEATEGQLVDLNNALEKLIDRK